MQEFTTHSPVKGWDTTQFEPAPVPPGAGASEDDVAHFFDQLRHLGCDLSDGEILCYCEDEGLTTRPGFTVSGVFSELEALAADYPLAHLGSVQHRPWEWAALHASVALPTYVDHCPRLRWRMSMERGRIFSVRSYCKTYLCSTLCAEVRVKADARWACDVFLDHRPWSHENLTRPRGVWHTIVPFDERLYDRLNTRRKRIGGGFGRFHREKDGQVHIYSSVDLACRSKCPPTEGEWMTPWEALGKLMSVTLVLPGVTERRWNGTWRPPPQKRAGATSFDLGRAPRDLMDEALKAAEARLEALLGPYARERLTPEQVGDVWLPIVQEELDREWGQWKATGNDE